VPGDRAGGQAQHRAEQVLAEQVRLGQGGAERLLDHVVDGVAVAQPGGDVAGQHRRGLLVELAERGTVAGVQLGQQIRVRLGVGLAQRVG
jgi:hypothetical protein